MAQRRHHVRFHYEDRELIMALMFIHCLLTIDLESVVEVSFRRTEGNNVFSIHVALP